MLSIVSTSVSWQTISAIKDRVRKRSVAEFQLCLRENIIVFFTSGGNSKSFVHQAVWLNSEHRRPKFVSTLAKDVMARHTQCGYNIIQYVTIVKLITKQTAEFCYTVYNAQCNTILKLCYNASTSNIISTTEYDRTFNTVLQIPVQLIDGSTDHVWLAWHWVPTQ